MVCVRAKCRVGAGWIDCFVLLLIIIFVIDVIVVIITDS